MEEGELLLGPALLLINTTFPSLRRRERRNKTRPGDKVY